MARRGRPSINRAACPRRDELLAAAAAAFARDGYQQTDVQRIADGCGIAKGTVYLYFRSKQKLFLAAVDRAMALLREAVREASSDTPDPLDRLAAAVRAYFGFFHDHPEHAELLIQERAEFRDRRTPTYLDHRQAAAAEWGEVYAALIRGRRVRQMPVEQIMRVVSDLVYGSMFTNHFTGRRRTPDEQAADVLDILFHGILTPAERRRRGG